MLECLVECLVRIAQEKEQKAPDTEPLLRRLISAISATIGYLMAKVVMDGV